MCSANEALSAFVVFPAYMNDFIHKKYKKCCWIALKKRNQLQLSHKRT
jgi:hypothetical protein